MRKIVFATLLCCGAVFPALSVAAGKGLVAAHAWVPEAPPVASVMAGYVVFKNETQAPIELVSASSAQFDSVEFHRSVEQDGMARMVQQAQLLIPAGEQLALTPGGYHLMLIGPEQSYSVGEQIVVQFAAASGEQWTVNFEVRKPGAGTHHHHHHH